MALSPFLLPRLTPYPLLLPPLPPCCLSALAAPALPAHLCPAMGCACSSIAAGSCPCRNPRGRAHRGSTHLCPTAAPTKTPACRTQVGGHSGWHGGPQSPGSQHPPVCHQAPSAASCCLSSLPVSSQCPSPLLTGYTSCSQFPVAVPTGSGMPRVCRRLEGGQGPEGPGKMGQKGTTRGAQDPSGGEQLVPGGTLGGHQPLPRGQIQGVVRGEAHGVWVLAGGAGVIGAG